MSCSASNEAPCSPGEFAARFGHGLASACARQDKAFASAQDSSSFPVSLLAAFRARSAALRCQAPLLSWAGYFPRRAAFRLALPFEGSRLSASPQLGRPSRHFCHRHAAKGCLSLVFTCGRSSASFLFGVGSWPNCSIERTRPGKPGRASHVKRWAS